MKKSLLFWITTILFITYNLSDAKCINIDDKATWINVDGTIIRVFTKDKDALVQIIIDYPKYQVRDNSKIKFKQQKMCDGDEIVIDGVTLGNTKSIFHKG